jgi:hypothetical protein
MAGFEVTTEGRTDWLSAEDSTDFIMRYPGVPSIPVTHSVMMQDFTKWLHRNGGTPREITHRNHVREILGSGKDGKS